MNTLTEIELLNRKINELESEISKLSNDKHFDICQNCLAFHSECHSKAMAVVE